MTIGIIGAGSIGAAVARRLAQANIPTILSNSRGGNSTKAAGPSTSRVAP